MSRDAGSPSGAPCRASAFDPGSTAWPSRRGSRAACATTPAGSRSRPSGAPEALEAFLRRLGTEAPPAALLREVREEVIPAASPVASRSSRSEGEGARRVSIPPDLATCPECLREIQDPADRRHLYPFTNCTHCGPRFTIARDVPYDRLATTMAGFAMCPACRREYEDPLDRRFHAQPVACPDCGPRLRAPERRRARGGRGSGRDRGGRGRAARRADRGGQGPRRLPPRLRRHVGRGGRAAPRAQAPRREAVRGHGARPRRGAGPGVPRRRRGGSPRLGRAPDRPRPAAARQRPRPRGRRPATPSWA